MASLDIDEVILNNLDIDKVTANRSRFKRGHGEGQWDARPDSLGEEN